jgi:hypothetical protein
VITITLALSCFAAMSHLYDDNEKTPAIAIGVGGLATLGWVYTNYMNMRHQQRAHTMNVLLSLRTNAVLNEHRINFFRAYPFPKQISIDDMPGLKTESSDPKSYNISSSNRATSTLDSVRYMANLYEFICVGMRQGDLDETIIKMSLRGILVHFYDTVEPFIDDVRANNPRAYENYRFYVNRFRQ